MGAQKFIVYEISEEDQILYQRLLPEASVLLDALKWINWERLAEKARRFYSQRTSGSPVYPVEMLLKLEFLIYFSGSSCRQCVQRARYDLHWKYFLGLPVLAEVPHHSTMTYFRGLIGPEGYRDIFDDIVAQARSHALVGDQLRIKDATHIVADVAVPSALGLFAQLRNKMIRAIEAYDPDAVVSFQIDLENIRRLDGDSTTHQSLLRRVELVRELLAWICDQSEESMGTRSKQWQNLQSVRQLAEKILWDIDHPNAGDRTISVVDPDARRGKHGDFYDGYLLDVMIDEASQLVTSIDVMPANGGEAANAITLLQAEETIHGNDVEELSIDSIGFNGEVLEALSNEKGPDVQVFTPPYEFTGTEGFDSIEFEPIDEGERVVCPAGEVSGKGYRRANKPNTTSYVFSAATCSGCPLLEQCQPNRDRESKSGRRVSKNRYERQYAAARATASTERYAEVRRLHPAIERKLNEFVRHHRARRARYRGRRRVLMQQLMTAVVINIKRIGKLLGGRRASTTVSAV